MKISFNWLKTYLDTGLAPDEIAAILTSTGLEVESLEKAESIKGGLEGVVIGEVLAVNEHPDAERLRITTVNIGSSESLQIVCGAPNVAAGQRVLVATIGTTIFPNTGEPVKIKKSKIRGVESHGMICAEDELGLGNSHDGILVLPQDAPVGISAKNYLKLEDDFLFEIGLTPNRSDAMSHWGVLRDLKAYLNFHKKTSHTPALPLFPQLSDSPTTVAGLKITVEDSANCIRYSGAVVHNIRVSESPDWLKNRLRSIGLKPINNVVDITNFVMHEFGNPLHAFDLAKVSGKIVVRHAKADESIVTLDGITRKLNIYDLCICNESGPLCIAGVMGGIDSGISEKTTSLFLEAACFAPQSVRKTTKRHALNSDSSFRFERGVDPENVLIARDRAIQLILEIAGGKLESVYDFYPKVVTRKTIQVDLNQIRKLCGKNISNQEIHKILAELEFVILSEKGDQLEVEVPTYRYDVTRQADIAEEVLRIYGFNNIDVPSKLNASVTYSIKPDHEKMVNLIADLLVSSGYSETMNNSLTSSENSKKNKVSYLDESRAVRILNPLSNELNILRQSMIEGGLTVIEYNQNRQHPDLKLFEFGKVYEQTESCFIETKKLAVFVTGNRYTENWTAGSLKSSFFTLKSTVRKITGRLGIDSMLTESSRTLKALQDGLALNFGNAEICQMGWLEPKFVKEFGVKQQVFYAEFNLENLIAASAKTKLEFKPIAKTQFVRRDFSLLLDEHVTFDAIQKAAVSVNKKLLREVGLFDVYEGKNLVAGKKSYAISFTFQDDEKTLQDEQVDKLMLSIREKLQVELGAELR